MIIRLVCCNLPASFGLREAKHSKFVPHRLQTRPTPCGITKFRTKALTSKPQISQFGVVSFSLGISPGLLSWKWKLFHYAWRLQLDTIYICGFFFKFPLLFFFSVQTKCFRAARQSWRMKMRLGTLYLVLLVLILDFQTASAQGKLSHLSYFSHKNQVNNLYVCVFCLFTFVFRFVLYKLKTVCLIVDSNNDFQEKKLGVWPCIPLNKVSEMTFKFHLNNRLIFKCWT